MKKFLTVFLVFILLFSLAACSSKNTPNGKYIAKISGITFGTLEFHGKKVEFTTSSGTSKGTYEMIENEINISYENGNSDKFTYDKESDTLDWAGLMTFNKEKWY